MGDKLRRILPKVATSTSLLGSFTCRKFTTWDRRLYFPSEGRRTEDFFARKIRRLRPGLNPRTRVPKVLLSPYVTKFQRAGCNLWLIGSKMFLESSWNVTAHGDAREGTWRGNWRMVWVASTLHTTSEHGVCSITTADAHTSAASSRLNWSPCRFKWTRPFRRKTKSGFCACAITFQTQSTRCSETELFKKC